MTCPVTGSIFNSLSFTVALYGVNGIQGRSRLSRCKGAKPFTLSMAVSSLSV